MLAEMMADETTRHVAAKYTPDQIGRRLSQLKAQDYPLDYRRQGGGQRTRLWTIRRDSLAGQPAETEPDPF